jgi:hypothetical protein
MSRYFTIAALAICTLGAIAQSANADNGWNGRRVVSHQRPNDLFYNSYVGPQPSGTAAQMYVAPVPVPQAMGHTYVTYQPFMPHEYMYQHHRSYWTHHPGNSWTRTKVRYHAGGNKLQAASFGLWDNTFWGHLQDANFFNHMDQLQAFDY